MKKYLGFKTNNEAEYTALYFALKYIVENPARRPGNKVRGIPIDHGNNDCCCGRYFPIITGGFSVCRNCGAVGNVE